METPLPDRTKELKQVKIRTEQMMNTYESTQNILSPQPTLAPSPGTYSQNFV